MKCSVQLSDFQTSVEKFGFSLDQTKDDRNTKECNYRYPMKIKISNLTTESRGFFIETNPLSTASVFVLTKKNIVKN